MVFPWNDPHWADAARFVADRDRPELSILAPDMFQWVLPRLKRYANTRLRPEARYDLVVLDKSRLDLITAAFARHALREMSAIHANPVLAVLSADPGAAALPAGDPDVRALDESLARRARQPDPRPPPDPVLPDAGEIVRFSTLSRGETARAMDLFWRHGGYAYQTLRDRAYVSEVDHWVAELAGTCAGQDVLDLCCGNGRLRAMLAADARVTGADISAYAVSVAWQSHGVPGAAMDAAQLAFADASFDTVLLVDSLEHVHAAAGAIAEAGRVCRPGGRLLVSSANSEGLNQRLSRALGTGGFVVNYQHVREHSPAEMRAMLEAAGFVVEREEGIFLYPWWGIPGLDQLVRAIEDNDPAIVEAQRELGRRAGPDYAFAFIVAARRVASAA